VNPELKKTERNTGKEKMFGKSFVKNLDKKFGKENFGKIF
jgi:hypothetical protein